MKRLLIPLMLFLLTLSFAMAEERVGTANPAAVYCDELGYDYEIRGSKGYCKFLFGECPEWDFYSGKCSPEMNYCAQVRMHPLSERAEPKHRG